MKQILIVLGLIVVLGVIAIIAKNLKTFGKIKLPYCKKDLLSPAELNFFRVLSQVIGDEFLIIFKVRLADIMSVLPGTKERQTAQNKINCKHVDFLVCNKTDLSAKFAIELDDKSHSLPSRMDRDDFLNEAFDAAGIPLVRIPVKRSYSTDELTAIIAESLNPQKAKPKSNTPSPAIPVCDKCGAEMALRTSQKGANAGNRFWGCSNYPNCRNIVGEVREF